MHIRPATRDDFDAILSALPEFWGERTPPVHHPLFIEEFDDGALVAVADAGGPIQAYLLGLFAPAKARAYVHIVAVRASARRQRLGHRLYDAFGERALARGCTELKAITAPVNAASIAFHTARGMEARLVPGYSGPGQDRVVFTQTLEPAQAPASIELVALVVEEYDPAIAFFVDALGFTLVEDSPARTNDGRPKRWVVVRPPGGGTGLLLARADGPEQAAAIGAQTAGRVGFFLRVPDFEAARSRMLAAGVRFVTDPRSEPYGRVAVFLDIAGNRWDLLGPR